MREARCVVLMGNFDGCHKGHQALIGRGLECKQRLQADQLVLVTFHPHPSVVLGKVSALERMPILAPSHQNRLLEQLGVDRWERIPFTIALSEMEPTDFLETCIQPLRPAAFVLGQDFRFGYQRRGSVDLLQAIFPEAEISVTEDVLFGGCRISSELVRQSLKEGDCAKLKSLLGREMSFLGVRDKGAGRGLKEGVGTLNLRVKSLLRRGVYVTRIKQGEKGFNAITNVGIRPTFEKEEEYLWVESHLLSEKQLVDFKEEEPFEVKLLTFLRDEKAFPTKELLFQQIHADISVARSWFTVGR